jgi:hypothetical protein
MSVPHATTPWYRELWPWLLMLPPLASVVGGVAMVYLAVGAPEALVVDDYARIEEITRERVAAERRAAELGVTARLELARRGADGVAVAVVLTGGAGFAAPPELILRARHAAREAADRTLALARRDGAYVGDTDLAAGRYDLELGPSDGAWRLTGTVAADRGSVTLAPASDESGR